MRDMTWQEVPRRRRSLAWLWVVGAAALLVLAFPGALVVSALVNNAGAAVISERIAARVAGPDVTVLGTHSEVGRWAGAGNGTQYLSAVVVESTLSEESLAEHVRELGETAAPALRLKVTGTSDEALGEAFYRSTIREKIGSLGAGPDRFVITQIESPESDFLYNWDLRGH